MRGIACLSLLLGGLVACMEHGPTICHGAHCAAADLPPPAPDLALPEPPPTGAYLWSRHFGGAGYDRALGVATAPNGDVLITGIFEGSVDFGGGPLRSAGKHDVFLARYRPGGEHLWSRRFGGPGAEDGYGVAVDAEGNVVLTAAFELTADFGGAPLGSAGGYDIALAKYSATGAHLWSRRFGGTLDDASSSVSIDRSGDLTITGYFNSEADFGGTPLTAVGLLDIFVARYGPAGEHRWSRGFGGVDYDFAFRAAPDPSGEVVLIGYYNETIDLGGGPLVSAGEKDILLARLGRDGQHLWSRRFGASQWDNGRWADIDPAGDIVVVGDFRSTVDFGGGPLTSTGPKALFVAKYAPDGAHRWSRSFGSEHLNDIPGIATDRWGNIITVGISNGTLSVGGDPIVDGGGWVAKYDGSGRHLWSKRTGGKGNEGVYGVAVGPGGALSIVGTFQDTADFGSGEVRSAGDFDGFVLQLAP